MLDKIVQVKRAEVIAQKQALPMEPLRHRVKPLEKPHRFHSALAKGLGVRLIAEVKKASPSKGLLCSEFEPVRLAQNYAAGGAAAISVLTDEPFFQGALSYLGDIKGKVNLPLLRKDFILDLYQVYQSRAAGADALLLIARILSLSELKEFINLTHELGMDALVEVHSKAEVEKSLQAGARILGINNRDLATFQTDIAVTLKLAPFIPSDCLVVSESGIRGPQDMQLLEQAGVKAALVGEALVTEKDVVKATRGLALYKEASG